MKKGQSIAEYYQQKLENPGSITTEVATRDLATFHSVMGNLPNPDPILKKAGKDIKVYEDLLYDDQVGMAVESLELAIQSQPWEIEANGASDSWLQYCEDMMQDWDHERIFGEAASARLFGYQPIEVMWETGQRWTITDLVGKPPEWFHYDDENQLRFKGKNNFVKGKELPEFKFIVPRNKPSYKNPYGVAALSKCFWPVAFKKGGLKFWLKFVEKYGTPYLVGKQPRNAGDKATDKLLDELEAMIQDAVAVIPDDSSVDILEAGGKGASADLFERHVRYHDGSIAKAIVGQTLTSQGSDQGAGSRALGEVHLQVFDHVKEGTMKFVSKTYNQALQWATDMNEGGPAPRFSWIAEEDVQKDRAERDTSLKETGVRFKKKYYVNRYNLEEDEFELAHDSENDPPPQQFKDRRSSPVSRLPAGQCPCGCGNDPVAHFQNQMEEEFPDQAAVDEATKDSDSQKRKLQLQGERALQPIVSLINEAESYEEAFEKLAEQYPLMDTDKLEEQLTRAMFVSELWGRISDQNEETNE